MSFNTKVARPHQTEAVTALSNANKGIINLPTGTGKSYIQSLSIIENIKEIDGHSVHVVLSPRILLSNQLFADIKVDLVTAGIDAQYGMVHSSRRNTTAEQSVSIRELEMAYGINYRSIDSTTSSITVTEWYNRSIRENVPLILMGTYDSAPRIISSGIPVDTLHCDEAHFLVPSSENGTEFAQIVDDFIAVKKFFYTATMKFTNGDLGMNNTERFGEVLYQKLPIDMIKAGDIVRPRIHTILQGAGNSAGNDDARDAAAIASALVEHSGLLTMSSNGAVIKPRLLVVAKDTRHLNALVESNALRTLQADRDNLAIFDISSEHGARINGEKVSRVAFLQTLKNLPADQEAIIIHINILAEGIDIPGITGIMPLDNLKFCKFLQTFGRATRLHPSDRKRIYGGLLGTEKEDLRRYVKPYAYIILPHYGELGEELAATFTSIIKSIRNYGFNPSEDIFVSAPKSALIPIVMGRTNERDDEGRVFQEFIGEIMHEVESSEIADELEEECKTLANDDIDLF